MQIIYKKNVYLYTKKSYTGRFALVDLDNGHPK